MDCMVGWSDADEQECGGGWSFNLKLLLSEFQPSYCLCRFYLRDMQIYSIISMLVFIKCVFMCDDCSVALRRSCFQ